MPDWGNCTVAREVAGLIFAAGLVAGGFLLWRFLRPRVTSEERERLRRLMVNGNGKLGDGEIVDFEGAAIVYSYKVGGVGYTAAQDVVSLEALLPSNHMSMIGPALVKFDPRNPANSIVLCEEWSGLRSVGP
jgi:hypothetical protein